MNRVRIVGGGLAGVLAALEAHRLGARRIELHEHFDQLGGELWPRVEHGLELRRRCVYFGGREDPVRKALEWRGVAFEDVADHCGSLSPSPRGEALATRDFSGPVLYARDNAYQRLAGEALTDRIRAYPADLHGPLTRYCQWRLGVWLDEVHASAAGAIGLEKVRLTSMPPPETVPEASLPRDGFAAMFLGLRRALEGLGVELHFNSLVSPRELIETDDGETVNVWTAAPGPLFDAIGRPQPKSVADTVASYVIAARWAGPTPFQLRNFTAKGSVFRLSFYESRGETLLSAECVNEVSDKALRREIQRLMAGFGGQTLKLGETLACDVSTRSDCLSTETARRLLVLRSALARKCGPNFITGAWEAWDMNERFRRISRALAPALTVVEDITQSRAAA